MKYDTDKRKPNKNGKRHETKLRKKAEVLIKSQMCAHSNENCVLESFDTTHV